MQMYPYLRERNKSEASLSDGSTLRPLSDCWPKNPLLANCVFSLHSFEGKAIPSASRFQIRLASFSWATVVATVEGSIISIRLISLEELPLECPKWLASYNRA